MEFKEKLLNDILEINPKISLKKGVVAKKIAMEHLYENVKYIQGFELTEFKSGSKFKNQDTLVARITPCLENGKTAYVNLLEENEIAFGSTEFFVIRAKEGKGDPQFIYYLMRHPKIREAIIKSMTGTSGRQRAHKEAILNYSMYLPNLNTQKKIGDFLSLFDSKIETNKNIIRNLEKLSQTLFKQWFIDFEFPNEKGEAYKSSGGEMIESELGKIPKGWEIKYFSNIMNISSGKRPKIKEDKLSAECPIPIIGASKVMGYTSGSLYKSPILIIGRVGTHGVVQKIVDSCWPSDNTLVIQSDHYNFVYEYLKIIDYTSLNRGSTQPLITQTDIKNQRLAFPKNLVLIELFENLLTPMLEKQFSLLKENEKLQQLRDKLLPKLISGELEIPEKLEV